MNWKHVLPLILSLFITLSCRTTIAPTEQLPATSSQSSQTESVPAATPQSTNTLVLPSATPDELRDEEGCPLSQDRLVAVGHPMLGFCMLLPGGYLVFESPLPFQNTVTYTAGSTIGNSGTGKPAVTIYVEPVLGRSAAEISMDYRYVSFKPDDEFIETQTEMAGLQATLFTLENVEQRLAVLIEGERAYILDVTPYREEHSLGSIYELGIALWETILASFTLIEPGQEEARFDLNSCTLTGKIQYADPDQGPLEILPWERGFVEFIVSNESNCAWGLGFEIAEFWMIDDEIVQSDLEFRAGLSLMAPGDIFQIGYGFSPPFDTPPGNYIVQYQLQAPDGSLFGEVYSIEITILESN